MQKKKRIESDTRTRAVRPSVLHRCAGIKRIVFFFAFDGESRGIFFLVRIFEGVNSGKGNVRRSIERGVTWERMFDFSRGVGDENEISWLVLCT